MLDSVEDVRQFIKNTITGETPGATLEELGAFLEEAVPERAEKCAEILEEELNCSVCTGIVIEAEITDCHHVFCNACLTRWMYEQRTCPTCRSTVRRTSSLDSPQHTRNVTLEAIVDAIMNKHVGDEYKQHKRVEIEKRVDSQNREFLIRLAEILKDARELRHTNN